MSALDWFGLTLAFLAPLPPERPVPPEPMRGSALAAALVIGSICLVMVLPMVMIWTFHRPEGEFRRHCEARGGLVRPTYLDGSGPQRCDLGSRHPAAS
ncbi:hypothetical protein [Methylobacterium gregans]|uniref:Uncharacterized protein n=1 Tax=Methylobacterium gregans TaxID=374424 RepID=A0AA37M9Q1_9HYPH|nr:hypothetical protein [Methylobacterium gregans]MDQ0520265.1 hypothetical protein [Methylobacterium gregans]GJD77655.1 hypothetical protein NBEOAGPD_0862 [Methylobacterium gregans]GLS52670.1 hypothetical protein GCM10007886_08530 [Methylobacterium gregans]